MEKAEEYKNVLQDLAESCYWHKLSASCQQAESLYVLKNSSGLDDYLDLLAEKDEILLDHSGDHGPWCGDERLYSTMPACIDEIPVSSTPGAIPNLTLVEDTAKVQTQFAEDSRKPESLTFSARDLESFLQDDSQEEMTSSSIEASLKDSSPMSEAQEIEVDMINEEIRKESHIEENLPAVPVDGSGSCVPKGVSNPSVVMEDSQVYSENFQALEENYNLLNWSMSCSEAETLYHEHEASSVLSSFQTSVGTNGFDHTTDILLNSDREETAVLLALKADYSLIKVTLLNVPVQLDGIVHNNYAGHLECVKDLLSEQIGADQKADVTALTFETEDAFENMSEAPGPDTVEVSVGVSESAHGCTSSRLSDLRDDASSNGSAGFLWTAEDQDDWESWSSDASVKSFDVPLPLGGFVGVTGMRGARKKKNGQCADKELQTENETVHEETQTEFFTADEVIQTENETLHQDVQTEGEIVQCCQCGVYSFLPLGEQFVIRLKEEMSQRLSLENLIRIVEKDAWNVRQELMDEREGVVSLQAEAADLKGKVSHAEHVSAELKSRNDELETSLEGARNMINRLEQQMSNTSYFNSGIDYMLEAKLSQGRAVEALAKVKVLQNELLHSQSEVNKLLEHISALTKEKNEMVSNSVHQELQQIADERVKDAELRALQLENEVFALKEENKQLKSLSSSTEKTASLMSSTTPYKFMFNEQMDPYKEILALREEMLHLKTKSLAYSSYPALDFTYGSAYQAGGDYTLNSPADPVLPEVGSVGTPDTVQWERAAYLSPEKFTGGPLIATGSDSGDSDWSDEDEDSVMSTDVIRNQSDMTSTLFHTSAEGDLYSGLTTHAGDRLKPSLPPKPRVPPKPKPIATSDRESISHGVSTGMAFLMLSEPEEGISFEESPVAPQLGVIKNHVVLQAVNGRPSIALSTNQYTNRSTIFAVDLLCSY
ncbi:uncharacterized protein LOC135463212 [Liolophura sinensis]|uniref:uncharacterized protein LOC135463212 n=1 Tax=Liolophura sinensis TaxID=3198878 RepID=UPI0031597DE3